MKIIAILLIISSIFKLFSLCFIDLSVNDVKNDIDPKLMKNIGYFIIITEGLLGLFCGAYILTMMQNGYIHCL